VSATGDARDAWSFTLAASTRFTLGISFSTTSTESSIPGQGYNLIATAPAKIILDPGTATNALLATFTAPGSTVATASGTLSAGQYLLTLVCRAEGNTSPYSGSFNSSLVLTVGSNALAITRVQALPQGLMLEWTDLGVRQYTVETTGSLSGGGWAPVSGVAWPIQTRSVLLPFPPASPAFFRVRVQ
jgi:hypothetical protein